MLVTSAFDIGSLMRERRKRLGLDQAELARRVNVSRQWIVEVEKGKPRAEIGLILRTLGSLGFAISIDPRIEAATMRFDAVPSIDIDAIIDGLGPDRP